MTRETWEGKKVIVYFADSQLASIEGVVKRTPADMGNTWYIVREADAFIRRKEYAVQNFAYMEVIE